MPGAAKCKLLRAFPLWMDLAFPGFAEDWPPWLGPQRDAVWREISTRTPPRTEVATPATIAVESPCSGLAHDAITKIIASRSATTPTFKPATTFLQISPRRNGPSL